MLKLKNPRVILALVFFCTAILQFPIRASSEPIEPGWSIQNNHSNIGISHDGAETILSFQAGYDWATGELAQLQNKLVALQDNSYVFKFKADDLTGGWIPFALSWSASPNGIINTNGLIFNVTNNNLEIRNVGTTVANVSLNVMEYHSIRVWYSGSTVYVSVDGNQAASFVNANLSSQLSDAIAYQTGLTLSAGGGANTGIRFNIDTTNNGWTLQNSHGNVALIDNGSETVIHFGSSYNWGVGELAKLENKLMPDGENAFAFQLRAVNLTGGWIPVGLSWSASAGGVLNTNGLILNIINGYLEVRNLGTLVASIPINVTEYHSIRVWYSGSTIYVSADGNQVSFANANLAEQLSSAISNHTGLTLSVGGGQNTSVAINTDMTNNGWTTQNPAGRLGITDDGGLTTIRFGNNYNWGTGELAKLDNKVLPQSGNKFTFMFKVNDLTGGWLPFGLSWSAAPGGVLYTNGVVFNATNSNLEIRNAGTIVANVPMNVAEYHYISVWYGTGNVVNVSVDGILAASYTSADMVSQMQGAVSLNTGLTLSAGGGAANSITFGLQEDQVLTYNVSDFAGSSDWDKLNNALNALASCSRTAKAASQRIEFQLNLENRQYRMDQTLTIIDANHITIKGNGASLIFTKTVSAFYMNNSSEIAIANLSIDYDPLVFTQGVVQSVSGNQVTVKIDVGYRSDLAFLNNTSGNDGLIWSNIHDRATGGALAGSQHSYAYSTNAVNVGSGQIRLTKVFSPDSGARQPMVGDVISLFHRGPGAFIVTNCADMHLSGVNLYGSPGFGFSETGGKGGSVYTNVKVVPGQKPVGAAYARLRSANADGAHFGNVEIGPKLDHCEITHCGDDGVNVQGFFFYVLERNGNQLVVSPKWDTPLQVGETIEGYQGSGYSSAGTAKIIAFSSENNPAYTNAILAAYAHCDPSISSNTLIYRITLDKPLNLSAGDHITSLNRVGSGAVIQNSTFAYNRARGVVVKGHNILIENNTFISNTHPAIVAAADMYWCESGFVQDVVIRHNNISNSAICSNMIRDAEDQIGSILVSIAPTTEVTGFYNCTNNRNILIEDNTITNSQVYGIFAINCDGIQIRNNSITNAFMNGAGNVGAYYGIAPKSGIFVGKSANVAVTGNTVKASSVVTQAVEIHSTCFGSLTNTGNLLN